MKLVFLKFELSNLPLARAASLLAYGFLAACGQFPTPTGSAAHLSDTRFDYAAQRQADGALDGASRYRDIDEYLEEVSRVPFDWIRTGAPRLDRLSRETSTLLRKTVELVKAYQRGLETYKDTASFLNANSGKTIRELTLAIEQHDANPKLSPIRSKIKDFYDSQRIVFQNSEVVYRAMLSIVPILSDPDLPAREPETSIGDVVGFLIRNRILITKNGCNDPEGNKAHRYGADECNGMVRLCPENGKCFRRPVKEHQVLLSKALKRVDAQMQALVNGNEYITHIQQRLMSVAWGFGIDFADASGKTNSSYKNVENLSNLIQGASGYPIRSIDTAEKCENVWRAALTTLSEQDEKLIIGGWRPGAIVSDVTRHGWYGSPEYTRYFIVFERLRGKSLCRMSYRIMLYFREYYRSGRNISFDDVFAGKDKLVLQTHPENIANRYDTFLKDVMNELDAQQSK
jgi:hypothetical protein